jgi:predicted membrane protein
MAITSNPRTARRPTGRILLGLLVALVGVVLLLNTTGLYDTDALLVYVPSLFVVWGLYALIARRFTDVFGPLFLIAGGAAWQAVALDYVTAEEAVQFWPVLLVLIGVSIVVDHLRRGERTSRVIARADGDGFDVRAVFGEADRIVTGRPTAGDVVAVFGETRVDLSELTRDPGDPTMVVDLAAVLGEIDLRVPRDWTVVVDASPILGEVTDRRRHAGDGEVPDLVVDGFVFLGEVTLTD